MTPFSIGCLGMLVLILTICARIPIGVGMVLVGTGGFALLSGLEPAMGIAQGVPYETFVQYSYSVVPLFLLMGQFAFKSGVSRKLCLSIFISSYTRPSSPLSFANENKACAYRDEIVPKSITYDFNDISSSNLLMITSWLLSRLILSCITFSAIAIDKSVISARTSRIARSFSSRIRRVASSICK